MVGLAEIELQDVARRFGRQVVLLGLEDVVPDDGTGRGRGKAKHG